MKDKSISKKKSNITLCLVIAMALLDATALAQNCYTPINAIGKCIPITYCQSLLHSFQNPNRGAGQTQYLIKSQCGYLETTPLVCCPLIDQSNGGCIFGICTEIEFCPSVMRLQQTYGMGPSWQKYLSQVSCNGQYGISVCCRDYIHGQSFPQPIQPVYKPDLTQIVWPEYNNRPNIVHKYPTIRPPSVNVVQNGGSGTSRPKIRTRRPKKPSTTVPPTAPPKTNPTTAPPKTIPTTIKPHRPEVILPQKPEVILPQKPEAPLNLPNNTYNPPNIITKPITNKIRFAPPSVYVDEGVAKSILQSAGRCGLSATDDRKVGANETGLDQYPWMGLIEYRNPNGEVKVACGSSLIAKRYLLTAAHCVSRSSIQEIGEPTTIRLGEFDKRLTIDCQTVDGGKEQCNDRPVRISVEKIISHPNYDQSGKGHRNDIALIRLASDAPYTEFIRPICLPSYDITQKTGKNFELTVAGWGTTMRGGSSNRKLHVRLPLVEINACQQFYLDSRLRASLWGHQICAGGVLGKDSCRGDSGGALMMQEVDKHYELHGIVSFGSTPCGRANIPGVYTKVAGYVPWIKSTLRY